MAKIKAKIKSPADKCMDGVELKRVRKLAGLNQEQLAKKMDSWGWYRQKVVDLEHTKEFCLNPIEMQAVLDALGAIPWERMKK